jgi:rhomboid family GlyGly-CTERM serine protease
MVAVALAVGRPGNSRVSAATDTFRRQWPVITAGLALAAIAAYLAPGAGADLEYRRSAIAAGEWWRLLSGHLSHWSADHLLWDVAVLIALGTVAERTGRARMAACVLISAGIISAAVWTLLSGMATYRGLSGIDSALFGLVAAAGLRRSMREARWGGVCLLAAIGLAFAAKLGVEWIVGRTVFVNSAGVMTTVPLAHVVGLAVGVACGVPGAGARPPRPARQRRSGGRPSTRPPSFPRAATSVLRAVGVRRMCNGRSQRI